MTTTTKEVSNKRLLSEAVKLQAKGTARPASIVAEKYGVSVGRVAALLANYTRQNIKPAATPPAEKVAAAIKPAPIKRAMPKRKPATATPKTITVKVLPNMFTPTMAINKPRSNRQAQDYITVGHRLIALGQEHINKKK